MLLEVLQVEPVVAPGVDSDLEQPVSLANGEPLDLPTRPVADLGDRAGYLIRNSGRIRAAGHSQQQEREGEHQARGHGSESGGCHVGGPR